MNLDFVVRKRRKQPLPRDVEVTQELTAKLARLNAIDLQKNQVTAEREARVSAVTKRYDQELARLEAVRPLAERQVRRLARTRWRSLLWHGRKTVKTEVGEVQYYTDPKGKIDVIDQDLLLASLSEQGLDELFLEWVPKIRLDVMHVHLEQLDSLEGLEYHPPRARIRIKTQAMIEAARRKN